MSLEIADDDETGGTQVTLEPGDSLKSVPRSHRKIITPQIEAWWPDPMGEVRRIAERAVTPHMGEWFHRIADSGTWQLNLNKFTGINSTVTRAGYYFSCPGIRGAELSPPSEKLEKHMPIDLARYYRLVGWIDWMGFPAAGGIKGPDGHMPLSLSAFSYHGAHIDPARTYFFGDSPGGDSMLYTVDGRGGWFNMGTHEIRLLGTVLDTIDWAYSELLANRCPDYFCVR